MDVAAVTALVETVAYELVLPRFRALVDGDVSEKAPGDLVTVVDTAAEAEIIAGLAAIAPGIPVVGEEGSAADPAVLAALPGLPVAFLVDPIDGTRAFVDGAPDYAVMVALVSGGASVASWICLPSRGHTYVAERGSGAWRDGVRMAPPDRPDEPRVLIGPTRDDAALVERARRVGLPSIGVGRRMWAGRHYTALADGEVDALGYWAGWPWDHAPGAVLVRELGGVVAGMDGKDYRPKDVAERVVVAADRQLHDVVRGLMGPED